MGQNRKRFTATLIYLVEDNKVLMARKVRKLIVKRFCGFGGKVEKGETVKQAAVRELKKESGLYCDKQDLEFAAVMEFHNQDAEGVETTVRVFVFTTTRWRGELKLKEDEVRGAQWFKIARLPLKNMPVSDRLWLPQVLSGKKIKGEAWHGPDQKTLLDYNIKEVKYLGDIK